MRLLWESLLSENARRSQSSDIRDLLSVSIQRDVISFAGGLPAPELFPVEALRAAFDAVLSTDSAEALQYGPTEGYTPLRDFLADRLARRGIFVTSEEILITTGSQQGLDLLSKVLVDTHSSVIVEAPSYVGALQAFASQGPNYIAIPVDEEGMRVDLALEILKSIMYESNAKLALLYTVATFQNPSGLTLSEKRRLALLELCAAHNLPLVEDDPYGELFYDGKAITPLRSMPGGEETIYLGTFSKILAPGLRLGWVVAPKPLISHLVIAKQAADLFTDSLVQRAVLYYCLHNDIDSHIAKLRTVYCERRNTMLMALSQYFPSNVKWTYPEGGFFIWVTLPTGFDAKAILDEALACGVAYVPGSAFYVDNQGDNCLRLNFSHVNPERINEGVRRLSKVLTKHLVLK